jgi:hypothetical protein
VNTCRYFRCCEHCCRYLRCCEHCCRYLRRSEHCCRYHVINNISDEAINTELMIPREHILHLQRYRHSDSNIYNSALL